MGVLRVKVAGAWVDVIGSGSDEVLVGPSDPIAVVPSTELWYDTDAVAPVAPPGIPAGGATGQALVKTSAVDFAVGWGTVPRPANAPWGVIAMVNQGGGGAVNIGSSGGPFYLHAPLVMTGVAGRQYKICWHMRAVARQDNSASPASSNVGLYDGTTASGLVDAWFHFAGQWKSFSAEVPFTAVGAKSYRLAYGNQPAPLTVCMSAVWIEDIGPVV